MSTQVAQSPTISGAQDSTQITKLPELTAIKEEQNYGSDDAAAAEKKEQPHLPDIPPASQTKAEKLLNLLRLAGAGDEITTGSLLRAVKMEMMAALEELRVITTHDDNLERQYREAVAENSKLQVDLDKARREIRHLKGQLSLLQMTPAGIREERARTQQREKRKAEQERKIKQQRSFNPDDPITVLTAAERARTVDAKGDYIDQHKSGHTRRSTYPNNLPSETFASTSYGKRKKLEPLPPTLIDCSCSVCNSKQSFGALTLGKGGVCPHTMSQLTRSGQQILLGDRVVIKAERLGSVCYIGKLDFDPSNTIYIGVHLDLPIGNCDGLLKGRRYFHCPSNHGVFVRAADVICVTGRKPLSGGTTVPRIREKLPTGLEISRSTQRAKTPSKTATPVGHISTATSSITMSQVRTTVESEMAMLNGREPEDLTDPSTAEMSRRMKELAEKQQRAAQKSPKPQTPPSSPVRDHSPTPTPQLDPSSLPPARAETPLERTLLEMLNDKDLGATGFVTADELAAVLGTLPDNKALKEEQIQRLYVSLGIDSEEGLGLAYHALVPYIMQALEQ